MNGQSLEKLTDRELLILLTERQGAHLESHKQLSMKVDKIETKILESMEERIRHLENAAFEKKGAYKFWILILGIISATSLILGISKYL